MQNDDKKTTSNDDSDVQGADVIEMDSLQEGKGERFADGMIVGEKDPLDSTEDLNNLDAPLDEGLGDDAFEDTEDSTLPVENDSDDETATGMPESDFDDVPPIMQNAGDIVIDNDVAA